MRLVAVGVAIVAAVAGWWAWWDAGAAQRLVESRVLSVLRDPQSARFRAVIYHPKHDVGCGVVNAAGAAGGMAGERVFMAFSDGEVRLMPEPGSGELGAWTAQARVYCSPDDGPDTRAFWDLVTQKVTGLSP